MINEIINTLKIYLLLTLLSQKMVRLLRNFLLTSMFFLENQYIIVFNNTKDWKTPKLRNEFFYFSILAYYMNINIWVK